MGDGTQRGVLELVGQRVGCRILTLGRREQVIFGRPLAVLVRRPIEGVIALPLEFARQSEKRRHVRKKDARGLATASRAHETPDGLGEEQRGGRRRCVDADRKPWHVDALRHHSYRDHPPGRVGGEGLDTRGCLGLVRQHDGGLLTGHCLQDLRVGPSGGLVGGDHEATGIRDVLSHFGEPAVGGAQHCRNPLAAGIESCPPGLRRDVFRVVLPELGLHLVAGAGSPPHVAGVDKKEHGTHDTVFERTSIPVVVVGTRHPDAVGGGVVLHEGDGRRVAAERRTRQQQPPRCTSEGLAEGVSPAEGIPAVVHLVEDHEGSGRLGHHPMHRCLRGDLRVRDRDPVVMAGRASVPIREVRVKPQRDPGCSVGPLGLQMLGRGDHDDPVDDVAPQQLGSKAQCEGRLAGAGRRGSEEVARSTAGTVGPVHVEVPVEGFGLPRAEAPGRSPGCTLRVGRRQVFGGEAPPGMVRCRDRRCLVHAPPPTNIGRSSDRPTTIDDQEDRAWPPPTNTELRSSRTANLTPGDGSWRSVIRSRKASVTPTRPTPDRTWAGPIA